MLAFGTVVRVGLGLLRRRVCGKGIMNVYNEKRVRTFHAYEGQDFNLHFLFYCGKSILGSLL